MGACPLGPEAFEVLLNTQSMSLQYVQMSGRVVRGTNSSPWIQRLLASCPRLEILAVKYSEAEITFGVHLHVDDILTGPWVCPNLSSFYVPIVGVPPTGPLVQGRGGVDRATVIDRVMRQIGKMTKLKQFGSTTIAKVRLDTGALSAGSTQAFVAPDTLPFSLGPGSGGGLQHLAKLTELEELGLRRHALEIGINEAKWMTEHWKAFRKVCGLHRSWDAGAMDAVAWIKSKKVEVTDS
ncbi:hypothetical protein DFQ26_004350 [Actinomortierella ambigua]|nr:hypothetical protein DFQ26_004350 [Actinomortierella ambigua]